MINYSVQVLQRNQNHQGSQLQAGVRAEMIPSPLTRSLATWKGRLLSRSVMVLNVGSDVLGYIALRPFVMVEAIDYALERTTSPTPIVLDPASGYAVHYVWLAEKHSDVRFIEMDDPNVVRDKKMRLGGYTFPPNLEFRPHDFRVNPSLDVITEIAPDVMVIMAAYVSSDELIGLLHQLKLSLKPHTWLIISFPYRPGIVNYVQNNMLFSRLSGSTPLGTVDSLADIDRIVGQAGYDDVHTIDFSSTAEKLGKAPAADIEMMALVQT